MRKTVGFIFVMALMLLGCIDVQASPLKDEESVWLLAHLIGAEAGADYCSDDLMRYTGSVVLNRVEDSAFPNTIEDVIFDKGQYYCVKSGSFYNEPTERCWEVAKDLVENGSYLPTYVVFQAEFEQGNGMYCKEQNMYFCTKKGTR